MEALGVCTIDAGGETSIADISRFYNLLGKRVFAICDAQDAVAKAEIEDEVELLLMHDEIGLEDLVLNNTTEEALARFAHLLEWPAHLATRYPDPAAEAGAALRDYFRWSKGNWGVADFLAQCELDEIPRWLRDSAQLLAQACETTTASPNPGAPDAATAE